MLLCMPATPEPRRSALERLLLAQRIDEARRNETTWDQIAKKEGVPKRTAQDIHRKFLAQVQALQDPRQALIETVYLSTSAIDVLVREMEEGDSSSARVGAARAVLRAQRDRLNLLASVGYLPWNIGARTRYRNARRYGKKISDVLRRNDIPDHVWRQIEAIDNDVPEDGIEDVTPPWSLQEPKEQPW